MRHCGLTCSIEVVPSTCVPRPSTTMVLLCGPAHTPVEASPITNSHFHLIVHMDRVSCMCLKPTKHVPHHASHFTAYNRHWNAVEVGPKRDLIGEIAQAVRDRGLKFGLYYSLYEWFHPLWRPQEEDTVADYVNSHMLPQLTDVVQRYSPSLIFADGEWDLPSSAWRSQEFLAWLYNESPCRAEVIVNDRWGKECRHMCAGYYT